MNLKQELHTWQEIPLAGNVTVPGKIQIFPEFPDPEGLLESAYAFLNRLKAPPMKLWTKQRSTEKYEEYFMPEKEPEQPKNTPQFSKQPGHPGTNPESEEDKILNQLRTQW